MTHHTYILPRHTTTTQHNTSDSDISYDWFVHDGLDEYHELSVHARVASGDYLEYLQTLLESIDSCPELDVISKELAYIQRRYDVSFQSKTRFKR